MKNFGGLVLALVILAFVAANGGVKFGSSASPLALPPVQRTAIYAPAEATRQAGGALSAISAGDAAAQEQEAARVYAQAAQEQAVKAREVATLQALAATQTANDITVSKEYATLTAVSLQATAQAISMTVAVDREQYAASVAAIQATRQAAAHAMINEADSGETRKSIDSIWAWFPTIAVIVLFALFVIAMWKLIGRITPVVVYEKEEVPDVKQQSETDPPVSIVTGLNFSSADDRTRLIDILKFSGRKFGWNQNRIAGKNDIPGLSGRMWDSAITWGKNHGYDIVTQQGNPANGGGTYAPGEIGSLKTLHDRVVLDPVIDALQSDSPTP
jgi:hypothetical protein